MARLTRSQQQERTRGWVLDAARAEFAEWGYAAAKVDRIAERAELTRGAVYSNFPSKRALYLAVLGDLVDQAVAGELPGSSPPSTAEALGAFARLWLGRLPLVDGAVVDRARAGGRLRLRSVDGVLDERCRTALAQVARLEALLLGLALESCERRRAGQLWRRVRLAELVLTLLDGSGHLAETAPGFGDPFDVARACEHLAGLDLDDSWDPPHLPYVAPARRCEDAWVPPAGAADLISGGRVAVDEDGVIALLGTSRLSAAEEAVRGAGPDDRVTVAVLTSDPAELGRLVRLRIGDLAGCLRRVFAPGTWGRLHLVLDDGAAIASAIGLPDAGDATEAAVRVQDGKIVARAGGRGAAHAAAIAGASNTARSGGAGT